MLPLLKSGPISILCISFRKESKNSLYACYQIGPFSVGLGGTIANTIRRFLLSDVSGIAFTEVQFAGVSHEYSTIDGVRESALEIMVNLQAILLSSEFFLLKPEYAFLEAVGPGNVTASSLILPPFVQCVDPTQHIATLAPTGFLRLKALISRSTLEVNRNFLNVEQKLEEGLLWDSPSTYPLKCLQEDQINHPKNLSNPLLKKIPNVFDWAGQLVFPLNPPVCPVTKVNFIIQPSVNHLSKEALLHKENIFLEIVTNGTIHPRRALHEAAKESVKSFSLFQNVIFFNALIEKVEDTLND